MKVKVCAYVQTNKDQLNRLLGPITM